MNSLIFLQSTSQSTSKSFHWADYLVLVIYLLFTLGIGLYFQFKSKLQKAENTDEYFKAGGKTPGWVAGFSIYATTLSAITYMATPAKAFSTDWLFAFGNLTIFIATPLLIRFIIPFFKKLNDVSGYGFLEKRFSYFLRVAASLMFILFHVIRVGLIIYLPTIALTAVTNINPYLIAVIIGIFCVISTVLGGLNGVIWSDFIQAVVLIGGILLAIIFALIKMPNLNEVNSIVINNHKLLAKESIIPQYWAKPWILILFFGQLINTFYQYIGSQDVVQRYQSNQSFKQVKKGLWTNAILSLITILLFYGMGTLLYAFYVQKTGLTSTDEIMKNIGINANNQILPYFIVTVLPVGISGLIIAGIYSASMSTISSSLHSAATCIVEDILIRIKPDLKDKQKMYWAKDLILGIGLLGTIAALVLIVTKADNLLDLFAAIIGLFGTSVTVIYLLGIFTKRTSNTGAILGAISSFIIVFVIFIINKTTKIAISDFYGIILAFIIGLLVGYLSSFIFKNKKLNQLEGLTVHTFSKQDFNKMVEDGEKEWQEIKASESQFKKDLINKIKNKKVANN
ncbi:sodium:solute symporter family [synthetic Mycoplasma mycoides JCVI-syn1.0]|uniref:Sodium:solute symporter family protein n=1 Tax=Mycoplasma mycoides subsp. capri TaxID=40477 RepID=A0AB38GE19_MYCMC|nr:sodium:solute symporter [Mycoplasma mycoides]ADH21813.1 sodium:solute symporter family [synthetic Mycoplasma mycoides JCVI-syn1.0]AMW77004.1 transporter, SSS family [synthetic bacterium JCVI-Syn2.0]ACU78552.1 sodium:solute symporter family [Mycoplasma mycoides subsp. capri str. GM12]ACU79383.1 sodium:solute symporter family [Mycoplasma mycoides subsp. capri str. GM12]SRX63218.1 sodium:solute symporter family protein [Mycoplasma mycoides subsp. capri]